MTPAFGKLAPPGTSHHAKKFGLLSLVVSVAVALGLVALGTDTNGAAWSGLFGRQGSGVASLDSDGTTQDHRDLASTGIDLSSETLSGPAHHLGLRHLNSGKTGWNAGTCTCTGSATLGGFDYIELHFSPGSEDDFETHIGSINGTMQVFSSKQGGTLMYDADGSVEEGLGTSGDWTTDGFGHELFRFNYPPLEKKITETWFRFCLDPNVLNGSSPDCTESNEDVTKCIVLDNGCYEWRAHTSCSVLPLIGEYILIGGEIKVEVVEWADRLEHVCRPCGNGHLNGGEECDNNDGSGPGNLPEGCTAECLCNQTAGYEPVYDTAGDLTGQCIRSFCGDNSLDEGEECDGGATCTENCTCDRSADLYPDPDIPGVCKSATCEKNGTDVCEAQNLACTCGACPGTVCEPNQTCCGTACINATSCDLQCPVNMTSPFAPVGSPIEATNSSGAIIEFDEASILPGANVTCVPSSGSIFEIGTTHVTCTATQDGYEDDCTFVVRVVDTTPPTTPTCPVNMTELNATGKPADPRLSNSAWEATQPNGTFDVTFTLPTARDDIDTAVTVTCDKKPTGDWFEIGDTTVTCTATDDSNLNSADEPNLESTCSFVVRVVDTTPPVFDPVNDPNDPNDPNKGCPIDMKELNATGKPADPRLSNSAWEATQPNGTFDVTFTLPTARDDIDTAVTVTCDKKPTGDWFEIGDTTVTCTATDDSNLNSADEPNLESTCSFVVRVVDTTPPVFDPVNDPNDPNDPNKGCPIDMKELNATGKPADPRLSNSAWEATQPNGTFDVIFTLPTARDDIDTAVTVTCDKKPTGDWFEIGDTTVTCTATDDSNLNSADEPNLESTCSFVVRVVDTTPPVFNPVDPNDPTNDPNKGCPIDMTDIGKIGVPTEGGAWEAKYPNGTDEVTFDLPTASDLVDTNVTVTCTKSPTGDWFPIGNTTVTCTAVDDSHLLNGPVHDLANLTDTCSFVVTVEKPCGNRKVDSGDPFNEECDGSPDCSDSCTCCKPEIVCPSDELQPINWLDCGDAFNVPDALTYNITASTNCADGGNNERSLNTTVSCAYTHPKDNFNITNFNITTITRTWTVTTDSPCNRIATCTQDINIHCPPAASSRRLLRSFVDESDDWVSSPSFRDLFSFTKNPKTDD